MVLKITNDHVSDRVHACESRREGEWLIFTCPKCKGFERRLNFVSGQMLFSPAENPDILHQGHYHPPGFEVGGVSLN